MEVGSSITVFIAAHNRLSLLKKAVASAVRQTFTPTEILVVDDGSDEMTRSWLEMESEHIPNLRVIYQPRRGVAAARQAGLESANTEFVCILDSDDQLREDALSRIMRVFNEVAEIDLVYSNYIMHLPDGASKKIMLPKYADNRAMIRGIFLRPCVPFKHSGATFRRAAALRLGGYNKTLPMKVDIDLILKFLRSGHRVHLLDDPAVEFLMHSGSISRDRVMGMAVWRRLVDEYGPASRGERLMYKAARSVAEVLKAIYERYRL